MIGFGGILPIQINPLAVNPKKILLLGPAWPYRGGPALFMTFVHEALKGEFEVRFVNFIMMYPRLLFPGTTPLDVSSVHHKKVPGPRLLHTLNPWYWWKTAQYIRRENPDLILYDWYQPFFGPMFFGIGLLLPGRLRKRMVAISENVISHEARSIDRFLTIIGLYWSRAFLALSHQVEKDLKPFQKNRPVYRSELPVFDAYQKSVLTRDKLLQKFGISTEDRVLLFFGYIRHYKGLDLLIDALKILRNEDNRYRLLIAGESYEDVNLYHQQIEKNSLRSAVYFQEAYIDNAEVGDWFEVADVVVLPYRSATQSGILNMAYGFHKPVIITDVGGLGEFVREGKTGIIVKEASAASIAAGIETFFLQKETTNFAEEIKKQISGNAFSDIKNTIGQIVEGIAPRY